MQRITVIPTLADVPYEALHKAGVRRIIFDYDGTLSRHWRQLPEKNVMELLGRLSKRFELLVFSNHFGVHHRRQEFFKKHGITYVRTHKPFVFEHTVVSKPKMTVLVGDKFLTDGLYALIRGIPCFLLRGRLIGL